MLADLSPSERLEVLYDLYYQQAEEISMRNQPERLVVLRTPAGRIIEVSAEIAIKRKAQGCVELKETA
jgi:hypothetical protein